MISSASTSGNGRADLRSRLPDEICPGLAWGPFSYRRYPVFGLPWLLRRTALLVTGIVLYGVLSMLGHLVMGSSWPDALAMLGYFIAGFGIMVTAGPALATAVRSRRFPTWVESTGVVLAFITGLVISVVSDGWASAGIARGMKMELPSAAVTGQNEADQVMGLLATMGATFIYFLASGGMAVLAYFSEKRRLRARAQHLAALDTDMRLAVLQAQIEPHFLFNTLASIRPLIRQDAMKAEAALDALAEHLRATIPQMRGTSGNPAGSTLGQQLDICAGYLAVMQVRMGARLHHEMEVPETLRERAFPPLILLSLVENAIKHGLEPKPGPGCIKVRAEAANGTLKVSVLDDGQGLKPGLSSGLGLSNIREQLQVRYGERARLTVAARPEGGTMAEIAIPVNA